MEPVGPVDVDTLDGVKEAEVDSDNVPEVGTPDVVDDDSVPDVEDNPTELLSVGIEIVEYTPVELDPLPVSVELVPGVGWLVELDSVPEAPGVVVELTLATDELEMMDGTDAVLVKEGVGIGVIGVGGPVLLPGKVALERGKLDEIDGGKVKDPVSVLAVDSGGPVVKVVLPIGTPVVTVVGYTVVNVMSDDSVDVTVVERDWVKLSLDDTVGLGGVVEVDIVGKGGAMVDSVTGGRLVPLDGPPVDADSPVRPLDEAVAPVSTVEFEVGNGGAEVSDPEGETVVIVPELRPVVNGGTPVLAETDAELLGRLPVPVADVGSEEVTLPPVAPVYDIVEFDNVYEGVRVEPFVGVGKEVMLDEVSVPEGILVETLLSVGPTVGMVPLDVGKGAEEVPVVVTEVIVPEVGVITGYDPVPVAVWVALEKGPVAVLLSVTFGDPVPVVGVPVSEPVMEDDNGTVGLVVIPEPVSPPEYVVELPVGYGIVDELPVSGPTEVGIWEVMLPVDGPVNVEDSVTDAAVILPVPNDEVPVGYPVNELELPVGYGAVKVLMDVSVELAGVEMGGAKDVVTDAEVPPDGTKEDGAEVGYPVLAMEDSLVLGEVADPPVLNIDIVELTEPVVLVVGNGTDAVLEETGRVRLLFVTLKIETLLVVKKLAVDNEPVAVVTGGEGAVPVPEVYVPVGPTEELFELVGNGGSDEDILGPVGMEVLLEDTGTLDPETDEETGPGVEPVNVAIVFVTGYPVNVDDVTVPVVGLTVCPVTEPLVG
ncbi:hypothetical protein F4778DRAFT_779694 [Xylariomycetidae sp. FL2044]|nr:hypothetical protein F4778DRAFT_779694 [Xylariomycetidae sp. FL2044]